MFDDQRVQVKMEVSCIIQLSLELQPRMVLLQTTSKSTVLFPKPLQNISEQLYLDQNPYIY